VNIVDQLICVIMLTYIIIPLLWNVFSLQLQDYGISTVIHLLLLVFDMVSLYVYMYIIYLYQITIFIHGVW